MRRGQPAGCPFYFCPGRSPATARSGPGKNRQAYDSLTGGGLPLYFKERRIETKKALLFILIFSVLATALPAEVRPAIRLWRGLDSAWYAGQPRGCALPEIGYKLVKLGVSQYKRPLICMMIFLGG